MAHEEARTAAPPQAGEEQVTLGSIRGRHGS